jgi:hypothetical protein
MRVGDAVAKRDAVVDAGQAAQQTGQRRMAEHRDAPRAGRLQLRAVATELDHVAVPGFQADQDRLAGKRS